MTFSRHSILSHIQYAGIFGHYRNHLHIIFANFFLKRQITLYRSFTETATWTEIYIHSVVYLLWVQHFCIFIVWQACGYNVKPVYGKKCKNGQYGLISAAKVPVNLYCLCNVKVCHRWTDIKSLECLSVCLSVCLSEISIIHDSNRSFCLISSQIWNIGHTCDNTDQIEWPIKPEAENVHDTSIYFRFSSLLGLCPWQRSHFSSNFNQILPRARTVHYHQFWQQNSHLTK